MAPGLAPARQQQGCYFGTATPGGVVERGLQTLVDAVRIGAVLEQEADGLRLASEGCQHHGRVAVGVIRTVGGEPDSSSSRTTSA